MKVCCSNDKAHGWHSSPLEEREREGGRKKLAKDRTIASEKMKKRKMMMIEFLSSINNDESFDSIFIEYKEREKQAERKSK